MSFTELVIFKKRACNPLRKDAGIGPQACLSSTCDASTAHPPAHRCFNVLEMRRTARAWCLTARPRQGEDAVTFPASRCFRQSDCWVLWWDKELSECSRRIPKADPPRELVFLTGYTPCTESIGKTDSLGILVDNDAKRAKIAKPKLLIRSTLQDFSLIPSRRLLRMASPQGLYSPRPRPDTRIRRSMYCTEPCLRPYACRTGSRLPELLLTQTHQSMPRQA